MIAATCQPRSGRVMLRSRSGRRSTPGCRPISRLSSTPSTARSRRCWPRARNTQSRHLQHDRGDARPALAHVRPDGQSSPWHRGRGGEYLATATRGRAARAAKNAHYDEKAHHHTFSRASPPPRGDASRQVRQIGAPAGSPVCHARRPSSKPHTKGAGPAVQTGRREGASPRRQRAEGAGTGLTVAPVWDLRPGRGLRDRRPPPPAPPRRPR